MGWIEAVTSGKEWLQLIHIQVWGTRSSQQTELDL